MSSDGSWEGYEDDDPYDVGSDYDDDQEGASIEHKDDWDPHEDDQEHEDPGTEIICLACGDPLDDDDSTCPTCGCCLNG